MNDWLLQLEAALTPARRKVLYRIGTAACLILSINGFISGEESETYLTSLALLLGTGVTELAAANVKDDE
jgi:hypothetical protein